MEAVTCRKNIPERLAPLEELSMNLWWCWNYDAEELFESIDSSTLERMFQKSNYISRDDLV